MEVKQALGSFSQWLLKYKYALLVLLLGVVLLLWPADRQKPEAEAVTPVVTEERSLEERLAGLLSQVEGAGQVQVILTMKTGTQYIYQTDETREEQSQGDERHSTVTTATVTVSNGSAQQQAVIAQTIYPTYQGALVISQGGDQPGVKLDLVNAVSSLTGLSADKITVIKMKEHQEEIT